MRRCGQGEGKADVVVGDDLAIIEVILLKVGFPRTGQLFMYPVPLPPLLSLLLRARACERQIALDFTYQCTLSLEYVVGIRKYLSVASRHCSRQLCAVQVGRQED